MSQSPILLEARAISKRYGGAIALDSVDFNLHRNAINVLIGENGAGKSTLMRVLAGVEEPDSGSIFLDGVPIQLRSPRDASTHGIAIVHQELAIMPNLDLSENIFAGRELTRSAMLDRSAEDDRSRAVLTRLHHLLAVNTSASMLSLGSRQIVEVARSLAHGARILILDEPTSALSVAETQVLFEILLELKSAGVSIVYISHRLHELLHLGDFFTVLRSGKVVGQAPRAEVTRQWIVECMSGRAATSDIAQRPPHTGKRALHALNLSLSASSNNDSAQVALHDVSFDLHEGEILGIYGLLGAGRTELLEVLAGNRTASGGTLQAGRLSRLPRDVSEAMAGGIVLVPEDRQRDGLIPELSIRENIALASPAGFVLSRKMELARIRALVNDLNIAVHDVELPVTVLSGGNQQKVLLARCLMLSPTILLLDEPTRGVDVGARSEIYSLIRALADRGVGVLLVSSEVPEVLGLADRVLVMRDGLVIHEAPAEELDEHRVLDLIMEGSAA